MASTTPVTTPAGSDPFAGFTGPGSGTLNTAPGSGSLTSPTGIPLPTGTSGGSKTFGGMPTDLNQPILQGEFTRNEPAKGIQKIPNYVDGDQSLPAQNSDPDYIRNLQTQMIQAGLLQQQKVHLGIWDQYSADAYAKVLAHANVTGQLAAAAMNDYVETSSAGLPSKPLNIDDAATMAQQVAANTIGRYLNVDEMNQFLNAYSQAYQTGQAGTTSAAQQGTAGTILASEHPYQAQGQAIRSTAQRIMQMLTSSNPGGQAGNQSSQTAPVGVG